MALKDKLEKLKKLAELNKEPDWESYKVQWTRAIEDLYETIIQRWFNDYEENGLMTFDKVITKRMDPYIGEYLTSILEITLAENRYLVIEPISAVTTEYYGKLEFYMRGNIYKKVSILRNIISDNEPEWIIAKSYDSKDHYKLNKTEIEKLIEEWLQ